MTFTPVQKQGIKPFDANTHKEFMDDVKKIATNIGMIATEVKHNESKAEEAQATSPPAPKPPESKPKKTVPVKMCVFCGFALTQKRAEECYNLEEPFTCNEDCAEKLNLKP